MAYQTVSVVWSSVGVFILRTHALNIERAGPLTSLVSHIISCCGSFTRPSLVNQVSYRAMRAAAPPGRESAEANWGEL